MRDVKQQRRSDPRTLAELPDVLTPAEVCRFLRLGRNNVYDLLKAGAIRSVRVGQQYRIGKAALRDFLGGGVE